MRRNLQFLLLCLLNFQVGFSQDAINDLSLGTSGTIQQISTGGFENILGLQTLNQDVSNFVQTHQVGDQNIAKINQKSGTGANSANQSYTFQQGNSNELSVGQIGGGNLLLSFQLGYMASEAGRLKGNHYGFGLGNGNDNAYGHQQIATDYLVVGERNKLTLNQDGNNNGVMAIQMGSDNTISAKQKGSNNYLAILQNGKNNSVTGVSQENYSDKVLFDTFIQVGENLSYNATEDSKPKPNGNKSNQSGINLSLQVNNQFVNSLGGIEINQKGKDMSVVIDQSYFSFPMK